MEVYDNSDICCNHTEGGYRNNVVFPMAGILEEDGEVKIYYGAADTHVCLTTARIDDLLAMCEPV